MLLLIALLMMLASLAILCFAIFALIALIVGAPYVPSSNERVKRMIELANIKPGDHVVDLGSGDGRLLVAAAARGARVTGIEINPPLVFLSKLWLWIKYPGKNHQVILGDFRRANLKTADIIFCYHLPGKMAALEQQITTHAKRGARVVLHAFAFPRLKPIQSDGKIFVYRIR